MRRQQGHRGPDGIARSCKAAVFLGCRVSCATFPIKCILYSRDLNYGVGELCSSALSFCFFKWMLNISCHLVQRTREGCTPEEGAV